MMHQHTAIQVRGFDPQDQVSITATSLYEASVKLGMIMREEAHAILATDKEFGEYEGYIDLAEITYQHFKKLVETGIFLINGIDYGMRYIESLQGFRAGAHITLIECVALQMEIHPGCQTLVVTNKHTGDIHFLHTEEDDVDYGFESLHYKYRLTTVRLPEKEVMFFAYPGICGWGPAFGIDLTHNLIQMIDDLNIRNTHNAGPLWHNAISFMFFDTGSLEIAKILTRRLETVLSRGCYGGYGIHMIQHIQDIPTHYSVEFATGLITPITPVQNEKYAVIGQANLPHNEWLQSKSESSLRNNHHRISEHDVLAHLEMSRRQKRLEKLGLTTNWEQHSKEDNLEKAIEVLQYPYGDLKRYKEDEVFYYYHTGLPSEWTVAHMAGYIGKLGSVIQIGKLVPPPIPGFEYSHDIRDGNYRFTEWKLWEHVEHERAQYEHI